MEGGPHTGEHHPSQASIGQFPADASQVGVANQAITAALERVRLFEEVAVVLAWDERGGGAGC
jgi:hypothetical protein